MGDSGGGQSFASPYTVPSPPSYGSQVSDYIDQLPKILSAMQQYNPEFAQLDFNLAKQYLPQYQQLNAQMYPYTSGLQEQIAQQASTGMQQGLPSWARDMYLDTMRSELGTNAGSPIGADYTSRGLMQQQKNWQDYYTNLALSAAGRQPLTNASMGQTQDAMFGLGNALGYGQGTYGSYISGLSAQPYYQKKGGSGTDWASLIGGGLGAGVGAYFGGPIGAGIGYGFGSQIGGMF